MKILPALALILFAVPASAQVFLSQDQALALAFPGEKTRQTLYFSEEEKIRIRADARAPVDMSVVTFYSGVLTDGTPGWAFFETHVIRTMPETFMTVVDEKNVVRFVELLSFYEPADYLPPRRWMDQFRGKSGNEDLTLKRGLRNVTGATLTAQSISDGVRRAVAFRKFIAEKK